MQDNILGDISAPTTLNRYVYVINNPLMYIDTSGQWLHILASTVVGAVAGAITGAASEVISAVVEQRPVNWKQAGVNALSGAAGGAVSGAVFATTRSVHLASTAGGAAGGFVGGFAGTLVNGGSVKDAFVSGGKGAISGAVGGFVGGSVGGVLGNVGGRLLGNTAGQIVGSISGSASGGGVSQYVGARLNGASRKEAWTIATNPKQVLTNALTGLTGYAAYKATSYAAVSLETYIQQKTAIAKAEVQKFSCGSAKKIQAADPVDEVTPKVPDVIDDAINQADDTLSTPSSDKIASEGGSKANVPNPNGKKGGLEHQSTISSIQPSKPSGEMRYEAKFNTPNGNKNYRYADAVEVANGEITSIHQVGKVNQNGTPVMRELQAISDIMASPDYNGAPIYFWPYNSNSGPIIFDY